MPWYGIALGAVVAISLIVLDEAIASKQPILGVSSCYLRNENCRLKVCVSAVLSTILLKSIAYSDSNISKKKYW